jgi:hypothetical protein
VQTAHLASGLDQLVQQHSKHDVSIAAVKHLPRRDSYGNRHCDDPHPPLQHKSAKQTRNNLHTRGTCTYMQASAKAVDAELLMNTADNVDAHCCGDEAVSVSAFCACGCGSRMEYWKTICRTGAMPSMLFSPDALAYSKSKAKQSPGSCRKMQHCSEASTYA